MRFARFPSSIFVVLVLSLSSVSAGAQQSAPSDLPIFPNDTGRAEENAARTAALRSALAERGTIEIIVGLDTPISPAKVVGRAVHRAQKARFRETASALASRVFGGTSPGRRFRPFDMIPYAAMTVNAAELDRVLSDPAVVNVQRNARLEPTPRLNKVVDITQADYMWSGKRANKGKGQTIAVIDSGFGTNIPSIKGRIVHEVCFSASASSLHGCVSNKDGDRTQRSVGKGAAWGCNKSAAIWAKKNKELIASGKAPKFCMKHGTLVASIAAAQSAKIKKFPKMLNGMAPKAALFLVRVGDFDVEKTIKAFEYIVKKRKKFGISAAAMSVGMARRSAVCPQVQPAVTAAVEAIVDAGIPFFNSAGNDGSTTTIDYPGCLEKVVSVGASNKKDASIPDFSDTNHLVGLLAPGNSIRVFKIEDTIEGSSFSNPAVAAGYALLKAANKKKTPDEILNAMRCTGKLLTRKDSDITVPRIDLKAAHMFLNTKKPKLRWDFDDEGDALGWVEMFGDWEVHNGNYVIGPHDDIWLSFVFNELCFENFALELRIRSDSPVPNQHGIMLIEEPKRTHEDPKDRLFSGFYWYMVNGYTTLLSIRDNKFNVDHDTARQGPAESVCNVESEIDKGGYNTQKAQLKNGRLKLFVNGELACDVDAGEFDLRSYGVFGFRRNSLGEPQGPHHLDYINIRGL